VLLCNKSLCDKSLSIVAIPSVKYFTLGIDIERKIFYAGADVNKGREQTNGKKSPQHRRGKGRLRIIKALVASRKYQYSTKVHDFIMEGCFDLEDIERCILSASVITKEEPDELETAIDGRKYTIIGVDAEGVSFYTCGKLIRNEEDQRIYFFITAHGQN
jgi:hypothetical protein